MSTAHTAALPERRKSPRAAAAGTLGRRERDFGIGYGRSSGYAAPRRYVDGQATRFFRCR